MKKQIALATLSTVLIFNQFAVAQMQVRKPAQQANADKKAINPLQAKMARQLLANLITLRQVGNIEKDAKLKSTIGQYILSSVPYSVGIPTASAAGIAMLAMINELFVGGDDLNPQSASIASVVSLSAQSVILWNSSKIITSTEAAEQNIKKSQSNKIATRIASAYGEILYLDNNEKEQIRYRIQNDLLLDGKVNVIETIVSLGYITDDTANLLLKLTEAGSRTKSKTTGEDMATVAHSLYRSTLLLGNLQASENQNVSLKNRVTTDLSKTNILLKQYELMTTK